MSVLENTPEPIPAPDAIADTTRGKSSQPTAASNAIGLPVGIPHPSHEGIPSASVDAVAGVVQPIRPPSPAKAKRMSAGDPSPGPTRKTKATGTSVLGAERSWAELRLYAELFHDVQQNRISVENKLRSGNVSDPVLDGILAGTETLEKNAGKLLRKAFKEAHPILFQWALSTAYVGEHTVARLLGVTGHPHLAQPYHWEGEGKTGKNKRRLVADPPYARGIRQFYAYCGVGDPTRKRRRGMLDGEQFRAGNPRATPIVFMLAKQQVMSGGKGFYSPLYYEVKERYQARDEWTDMHCHNAALRYVGKRILRDIWVNA